MPTRPDLDNQLTLHPEQARFPARCVSCGAHPSAEIVIETWKGIDLLYVAWGHTCEIAVPSCAACVSRRRLKRAVFLLASLVAVLGFIVGGAFIARASPVMPFVVFPGAIVGIWFLRRGELNLYHRWFSPIWLSRWRPKEKLVDLHFRDPTLCQDVGILSGVRSGAIENANYRDAAAVFPPPAWQRPGQRPWPRWARVSAFGGLAALLSFVGVAEFQKFAEYEETGRSIREDVRILWIYELGGKYAVLGFFGLASAVLAVAALAALSPRVASWLQRFKRR